MLSDYSFGYDPEVPGGFQDADIEMRELEERANEMRTVPAKKPTAIRTRDAVMEPRIIFVASDRKWRVLDEQGNAYVANYETWLDAKNALDAIRGDAQ